jgi:small ligand-binding sensory domain FIST
MLFASAKTTEPGAGDAVRSLIAQVKEQISDLTVDLVLVFISPSHLKSAKQISTGLRDALGPRTFIGCSGEGVIGRDEEIEGSPAVVLVAAHLPDVTVTPFSLRALDLHKTLGDPQALIPTFEVPEDSKLFVMLADPFSSPMDHVFSALNVSFPGIPVIGGMASGSSVPGESTLFLGDQLPSDGVVGVALGGAFDVDIIVSQGCRPIGPTYTITSVKDNVILGLDGKPPLVQIQDLLTQLPEGDQALLRNGLFVGRAIKPESDVFGRGDFLVRGVIGADQQSGAISVGDYIREGEIVRFHLRDAATAKEDLEMMLTPYTLFDEPMGALLFSCNGRGTRLYDHPNGDVSAINQFFPKIHLAGFFCAGEIGPIGGKNFLHGHTASLALFRPQQKTPPHG